MPSTSPPLAERKRALRATMKERLRQQAQAVSRSLSARAAESVMGIPEVARATGVLTCLSFGHEIDTWNLVDRWLRSGRAVYVPRSDPKDRRLSVHRYPCRLEELSFGLRQPSRDVPEVPDAEVGDLVDVVLILGLGFDRQGNRLGYGAGYFDRFLAGRALPAVGLAYHFQLVDSLPVEPHDVPMTAVVTDRGVWRPACYDGSSARRAGGPCR